jgi:hypothetical protein
MRPDEKDAIEFMCAERFPGMKNGGQLMFTDGCENGMHMIRHHDKFAELVTFRVTFRFIQSSFSRRSHSNLDCGKESASRKVTK